MKLKKVTATFEYVMVVEDDDEPIEQSIKALKLNGEVMSDLSWDDYDIEIENLRDLPIGWDGNCIPYGGDNMTTIKELANG